MGAAMACYALMVLDHAWGAMQPGPFEPRWPSIMDHLQVGIALSFTGAIPTSNL